MKNSLQLYRVCVLFLLIFIFLAIVKTQQLNRDIMNGLEPVEHIKTDTIYLDSIVHDTIYLPRQAYVKHLLDSLEVQHSDVVIAQAILESGWFECTNCSLDHNNPFGFQWKHEYLEFESDLEACQYMKWWQDKHYGSRDGYYEFLEARGYATGPNYQEKVESILEQI